MQPNPKLQERTLEILDNVVPADLHAAAWKRCSGSGWYFGHGSVIGDGSAFWKLDLETDPAFDSIWEHVRPRCEELAGTSLRVRRQYANGHTYGLGGKPHQDDGQFTLLYYPNPEWKDGWDGETMFYDRNGEIAAAVRPRPNRCVFFDAGILHAGRAPSRTCPALRVTVAYKLERHSGGPLPAKAVKRTAADPPVEQVPAEGLQVEQISAQGSSHAYAIRVPAARVNEAVGERLTKLAHSVRIPGYPPGEIPAAVISQRYGKQARQDTLQRLAGDAVIKALPKGSVASSAELKGGAESGDLEMLVSATHLPDIPPVDFSGVELERLSADEATVGGAGTTPDNAAQHFRGYLKAQVLDRLDAAYPFKILPSLIEREFAQIWKAAQSQTQIAPDAKAKAEAELRAIAERRLRLGLIIAELARRDAIHAHNGPELEDKVIDHLIGQARVVDRTVTEEELRQMLQD